jgi:hypothetical protein
MESLFYDTSDAALRRWNFDHEPGLGIWICVTFYGCNRAQRRPHFGALTARLSCVPWDTGKTNRFELNPYGQVN